MTSRPAGITAISIFFAFGALMSGLAAVMLMLPGSILDALWRLNPEARLGLTALGAPAVLLMCVVCVACATASIGLWRCRRWGLWAALALLALNLVGDALNAVVFHDWRTLIGLPIGGAMIGYLLAKRARLGSEPG